METQKLEKIEINAQNPEILVAVYGTLRKNCSNHHILRDKSEYMGTVTTEPKFTMYGKNAHFPIVVNEGNSAIECEIYKIRNSAILERLHSLEGFTGFKGHHKNWYDVTEVETEFGKAYMYTQDDKFDESNIIKSGNWNKRHFEKL